MIYHGYIFFYSVEFAILHKVSMYMTFLFFSLLFFFLDQLEMKKRKRAEGRMSVKPQYHEGRKVGGGIK